MGTFSKNSQKLSSSSSSSSSSSTNEANLNELRLRIESVTDEFQQATENYSGQKLEEAVVEFSVTRPTLENAVMVTHSFVEPNEKILS